MKKLGILSLLGAFVASSLVMFATSAWAVPVFARKYNVQCALCHTLPPRLTKAGVAFKENGFEMPSALPESENFGNVKLADDAIVPAGLPLTLRTGLDIILSDTVSHASVASQTGVPVNAGFREFGLIGGGNVGGVGFWIDAPGAVIGALDVDYKFNDMAKVKVGLFEPATTINYGLALQPAAIGGRNPVAKLSGATHTVGSAGLPAIELRGTTDATNGLGFNYAVGVTLPAAPIVAGQVPVGAVFESDTYVGAGYMIDAANTYVGLTYINGNNVGGSAITSGNTLLASATYNVGNPLQVILAYNSTNTTVGNVTTNFNGFSIQPEVNMDKFWAGLRYTTISSSVVGSVANTTLNVGVAYRFLQNLIWSLTYASTANNTYTPPSVANPDTSTVTASVDLIL